MNLLITICARKGSKGIKNKNLIKINKKSLINITLTQALNISKNFFVVVSSDYKSLNQKLPKLNNLYFLKRDKKLAKDNIGKLDVIIDASEKAEIYFKKKFDYVMDLDVTSPLRSIKDLKNCLGYIKKNKFQNLITLIPASKNPYFNMVEIKNKNLSLVKMNKNKNFLTRQSSPKVYEMNASIYLWKKESLLNKDLITVKTNYYVMPEYSIDIDSEYDLLFIRSVINKINFKYGF
tara:strand:- start:93 stop:797 length:705 start_codon:yes stop_codon:yes gene_type:complete